jgi:anti-anti-sigma factor
MRIQETKVEAVFILQPEERLDTTTSPEFEKRVVGLLSAGEQFFVIDLRNVAYMSSAGLRVLLMFLKKLSASGGKLVLCNLSPEIRQIFDIAGFTRMFTIASGREDALALFE